MMRNGCCHGAKIAPPSLVNLLTLLSSHDLKKGYHDEEIYSCR